MDIHPIIEEIFRDEKPESIFEIGCAVGGLMVPYIAQHPTVRVGGIEIVKDMVAGAKENFPNGDFICQDATKLWPLPDKSYDIVFSCGALIMIPDIIPVVREGLRVGKKFICAEFHDPSMDEKGYNPSFEGPWVSWRFYRNYIKVFEQFGIEVDIKQVSDKWVIKCKPTTEKGQ